MKTLLLLFSIFYSLSAAPDLQTPPTPGPILSTPAGLHHGTNRGLVITNITIIWTHPGGTNLAAFHIWHSLDLKTWQWFSVTTTNRFQTTNNQVAEYFRVRAVSPMGAVSDWATK